VCLTHLGCTLKETRVEIEDITGVGLTTGGTSEQEGHLAVSDGLLGEIVVNDEAVHSVVAEVLADGAARVGGQELQRGRVGGGRSNHDGVLESLALAEQANDVGDGGPLLADGDVDAVERLGVVASLVRSLLVENSVDGNRSLSSLSVANDEFTLATTDWDQGVDGLETSLHGFVDGLSGDDTRGLQLDSLSLVRQDGTFTIDGVAEGVDDTAEHAGTDWDIDDGAGSLHNISFLNFSVVSEHDNTNVVSLEIEGHTLDPRVEFNHLSGLDFGQTENSGNSITDGYNSSELFQVVDLVDLGNLGLEDGDGISD